MIGKYKAIEWGSVVRCTYSKIDFCPHRHLYVIVVVIVVVDDCCQVSILFSMKYDFQMANIVIKMAVVKR